MQLQLNRRFKKPLYTIGSLSIDGIYFCDTLEDPVREVKIPNDTCIPPGHYQVIINYSNRFNRLMPLLVNVPNFTGIRIHNGANQSNTSGCILVGKNTIRGRLSSSKETFDLLFSILSETTEGISITIS